MKNERSYGNKMDVFQERKIFTIAHTTPHFCFTFVLIHHDIYEAVVKAIIREMAINMKLKTFFSLERVKED